MLCSQPSSVCCALLFNYKPTIWGYFAVCPYHAAVVDEDGGIMIVDTLKRGPDCILKGKLKLTMNLAPVLLFPAMRS